MMWRAHTRQLAIATQVALPRGQMRDKIPRKQTELLLSDELAEKKRDPSATGANYVLQRQDCHAAGRLQRQKLAEVTMKTIAC